MPSELVRASQQVRMTLLEESDSNGTRESLQATRMSAGGRESGQWRDGSPELQEDDDDSRLKTAGTTAQIRAANRQVPGEGRHSDAAREDSSATSAQKRIQSKPSEAASRLDIRLLVRRREAGALIGKQGANIKRMRDQYRDSTFNIPDTGNGPERIVCISSDSWPSLEAILLEIGQLFLDKNCALGATSEDQVELKQLINSAYAGLLIGMGGQSIRKLRNDSKAAIKIYEMCCPSSDERVCAIKARPPVVVATIRMIRELMLASQASIRAPLSAQKPYDALNFDVLQVDKYGGHLADDCGPNVSPRASINSFGGLAGDRQLFFQRSNTHHHLIHFDPMGRGADVESIPLVVSSPVMFRPGAFLGPVHTLDFAPIHPLAANGPQFMSVHDAHEPWPRFSHDPAAPARAPTPAKIVQDHIRQQQQQQQQQQLRATPSAAQLFRGQRFHPYENPTHVRQAERTTTTTSTARQRQNQASADQSGQKQQQQQRAAVRQSPNGQESRSHSRACDGQPAELAE